MEVNKEELLIHILQGASNTVGMYPSNETNSSASLCDTNVACGYVLWMVTRSSVPWHSQTS